VSINYPFDIGEIDGILKKLFMEQSFDREKKSQRKALFN